MCVTQGNGSAADEGKRASKMCECNLSENTKCVVKKLVINLRRRFCPERDESPGILLTVI